MSEAPSTSSQRPAEGASQPPAPEMALPVLPSAALLQGQRAVAIEHNGAIYRLQTTRQGKLILTK
jgi:hemin uptake protein HemP